MNETEKVPDFRNRNRSSLWRTVFVWFHACSTVVYNQDGDNAARQSGEKLERTD